MCTISHQKCVCFVFLVVLAVLSCSGFRIDNLAMTDVTKRNSDALEHRLRHRRHAQLVNGKSKKCTEIDATWKAYKAGAVAIASVEGRTNKCMGNCTVQFKINCWLKNKNSGDDNLNLRNNKNGYCENEDAAQNTPGADNLIRLNFHTNRDGYCENEDPKHNSPDFIVKKNKTTNKRYFLYLKTDGRHNYQPVYAPELYRNRTFLQIKKVTNENFTPGKLKVHVDHLKPRSRQRLKLQCTVRGFPVPRVISWALNNVTLHPEHHPNGRRIKITTHKRRKSVLLVKKPTVREPRQYECIAESVDGVVYRGRVRKTTTSMKVPTTVPTTTSTPGPPCPVKLNSTFCHNGGTCFHIPSMNENACMCLTGFQGKQCEAKTSTHVSRYPQQSISPCTVGLQTKYNNC